MELIIVKNGHVFARADDTPQDGDVYELRQEESIPVYPEAPAGKGKMWELDYVNNVLAWVRIDRPLTAEERMEEIEKRVEELEYPAWKQPEGAHDAYPLGAKVTHADKRWTSTVDANVWEPGVFGWSEVTV